ncbi:Ribulokinase [Actinobacteria bacterium OV450]|nr:Ribulokinase [Actinobacteria bacterium OV450]
MPFSGAKDEKVTLTPAVRGSDRYVVGFGVDFGILSGRAVVVRVHDGQELATVVHEYPHAVVERELPGTGHPPPPDCALHHSEGRHEALCAIAPVAPVALAASGVDPAHVLAIAPDFTGCTVLPVLADGTPLAGTAERAAHPHARPKLCKYHAAQDQADRINTPAPARGEKWISRYAGRTSEAYLAALHPGLATSPAPSGSAPSSRSCPGSARSLPVRRSGQGCPRAARRPAARSTRTWPRWPLRPLRTANSAPAGVRPPATSSPAPPPRRSFQADDGARTAGVPPLPAALNGVVACRETYSYPMVK